MKKKAIILAIVLVATGVFLYFWHEASTMVLPVP